MCQNTATKDLRKHSSGISSRYSLDMHHNRQNEIKRSKHKVTLWYKFPLAAYQETYL